MTNAILLDQPVVQVEGNIVSNMNGEKVMLSIASGKYYNLGQVGGRIWEIVEQPSSVQQIVAQLTSEYEINEKECEAQVSAFLRHLLSEGLIRIQSE